MAYTLPVTVSAGGVITAAHLNSIRTGLSELQTIMPQTAVAVSFAANWADYGGGYAPCSVSRSGNLVVMTGLAKRSVSTYTTGTVATVPAGYRPDGTVVFAVQSNNAANSVIRLDVLASGVVQAGGTVSITSDGFISFAVSWLIDT